MPKREEVTVSGMTVKLPKYVTEKMVKDIVDTADKSGGARYVGQKRLQDLANKLGRAIGAQVRKAVKDA